jgi:hypothetical protein
MTTHDRLRQQIISRVAGQESEELATRAMQWWAAIARELIPLIGHDGFNFLYRRSLSLTQDCYPWLAPQALDPTFTSLGASLAARSSVDAFEAGVALLLVFGELLAGLIGESLTFSIINAAWGDNALYSGEKGNNHD